MQRNLTPPRKIDPTEVKIQNRKEDFLFDKLISTEIQIFT